MTKLLLIAGLVFCAVFTSCSSSGKNKSVTIASKTFTENILLSEMYAQLIENNTDIEVVRMQSLGGTPVCYASLENGETDIYVEYTGTAYNEILKLENTEALTAGETFDIVKKEMNDKKNITIYEPLGLNNTFALAMQRQKADSLGIEIIPDLSPLSSKMVFAANSAFYTRVSDGYDALTKKYGLKFESAAKMDYVKIYEAVSQGQVDVAVVYATDSHLKQNDMKILDDDKQMFPAYQGVPIARNDTLGKYPELDSVLNRLAHRIDNERMQELNYLVDVDGMQPDEVAAEFLKENGLIK